LAGVVSDSSSLVGLQRIDHLSLLQQLFGEVLVPEAVAREVVRKLPNLPPWVRIRKLSYPLPPEVIGQRLGDGESEAIALAFETSASRVIIDDLQARILASRLGLQVVGTAALLYMAKVRGVVPAVRPLLDAMLAKGFRLSPRVYRDVLRLAGEDQES
jgi:predicted nucleic acid-binding protein